MKIVKSFVFIAALFVAATSFAQDAEKVSLVQTPGKFETTELTLEAGKPYVFEIANQGIDHNVGFVVAPKGKTDQKNHVKEAYVTKAVADGETSISNVVTLEKGEYVYFCPLNPTPQYTIIVE